MYTNNRIDDSSYGDIKTLYQLSFGLISTVSSIQRKYDTSLFGLKNVGVIANDEKKEPAAYYGVFPIVLTYEGTDYLVAQSGDTMTAPNHRKRGLFETLAKECYALAETLGVKMVFGFPNENSFPGFKKKLDWYFTGVMQKFTIKGAIIPFCELASKYKVIDNFYQWYSKKIISKYLLGLTEHNISGFGFSNTKGFVKRDINFFKYKLNRDNIALISFNGIKLLIKYNTHLYIGDVSHIDESKTKDLLHSIKKLSRKLGCGKIIFTVSENHWLYDVLKKELTPTESLPIGFYQIDRTIVPEEIQFTMADYDTF
ncbi:MAG: GNAT family N-acetyltransferase [Bacteroidales bacterium]